MTPPSSLRLMFTKEEIQLLLQTAASVPGLLHCKPDSIEDISGSGILARSYVRKELQSFIGEVEGRTSVSEAARRLNIDQKDVHESLPADEHSWTLYGQQIIARKEYKRLSNLLRTELSSGIVEVTKFCRKHAINVDIFENLLNSGGNGQCWKWLTIEKALICGESYYDAFEQEVRDALQDADQPLDIVTAFNRKYDLMPTSVITRIATALIKDFEVNGVLTGTIYTPAALKLSQQDAVIAQLLRNGFIDVKSLKRAGIDKPDKFLKEKVPSAKLLKSSYVTLGFIDTLESNSVELLDYHGYCDFQISGDILTKEESKLLRDSFATKQKRRRKFQEFENYLVTPELFEKLTIASLNYASHQGELSWKSQLKTMQKPEFSTTIWQNLLEFTASSVPAKIVDLIAETLQTKATAAFLAKYEELRDAYNKHQKRKFIDELLASFIIHSRGLNQVEDSVTKEVLATELLQSYETSIAASLSELSSALADDNATSSAIADCREQIAGLGASDGTSFEKALQLLGVITGFVRSIGLEIPSSATLENKKMVMLGELRQALVANGLEDTLPTAIGIISASGEDSDCAILVASRASSPGTLIQMKDKFPREVYDVLEKVVQAPTTMVEADREMIQRFLTDI